MTNRVQIAGSASWRFDGDVLRIYDDRVLAVEGCPETTPIVMNLLEDGATREQLLRAWGDGHDAGALDSLLDLLARLRLLVSAVDARWLGTDVERQVSWLAAAGADANEAQLRLEASHVTIWGVGGVGSAVLQHLAGAGIRQFTLIDHDVVRPHNFNRQYLFSREHVGTPKLEAARAWLHRTYPAVRVVSWPHKIETVDALHEAQAGDRWSCLILAADEPVGELHEIAMRFGAQAQVPTIPGSCGFRHGSWGPLLEPADVPRWLQQQALEKRRCVLPPAPRPMAASFGPTNDIVGSFLARDVILYLAGLPAPSTSRLLTIDFETLRVHGTAVLGT